MPEGSRKFIFWKLKLIENIWHRRTHGEEIGQLVKRMWLKRCSLNSYMLSCVQLLWPMDCSPPGSSVHGIFQARLLKGVAISSSRGSFRSQDRTLISCVSCLVGRFFTTEPPGKPNVHRKCSRHKIRRFFHLRENKKARSEGKRCLVYNRVQL